MIDRTDHWRDRNEGMKMWGFNNKSNRNRWRDNLLMSAPEANPHEFVRRYLSTDRPTAFIAHRKPSQKLARVVAPLATNS